MMTFAGELLFSLLVLICLTATQGTEVQQCRSKNFDLTDKVTITNCEKPPCILKRKNNYFVQLRFKPDHDIKNLRTSVQGVLAGIPLPFVGVDGTPACGNLYESDGKTHAECPLKKGVEYVYINNFNILQVYPKVAVLVHWALVDQASRKDITCFEINARITS